MNLSNIIARAYDRPLLLEPSRAEVFFTYLSHRINADALVTDEQTLNRAEMQRKIDSFQKKEAHILGQEQYFDDEQYRPYSVVENVAVINVMGTLVNRSDWMDAMSGMTGYNTIAEYVRQADADPEVDGIFFHADSGGGEVAGCFDCADIIASAEKPTMWFSDEMSCSAAYALACGADKIIAPRTADVGSIGVLVAHQDVSEAMDKRGVKITLIHSGAHKVDGNPYEALPDDVQARWQAELDETRALFAGEVSKHRGISAESVLSTEAQVYNGPRALALGLIDAVMSRDEAFRSFSESLFTPRTPAQSSNQRDNQMTTETAPVAAVDDAVVLAAANEAAATEGNRIFAVLELPEAEAHMSTAIQLAKQGMSAEGALAILATMPEPQAQAPDVHAVALAAMQDSQDLETQEPAPVAVLRPAV